MLGVGESISRRLELSKCLHLLDKNRLNFFVGCLILLIKAQRSSKLRKIPVPIHSDTFLKTNFHHRILHIITPCLSIRKVGK